MEGWLAFAAVTAAVLVGLAVGVVVGRNARRDGVWRRRVDGRQAPPEVAGSLDLDDVVARILDRALALKDVDAAVLSLAGDERGGMVKSAGMSLEELARQGESGSKLSLPLEGELGPLGSLALYSSAVRNLERSAGSDAADIVRRAVPALDNAFRFREARRLSELDALTGLRNRRFFHETLQREVARAQRYGRSLGLLVLDLDDFKAINAKVGHLAGDSVLAETAARIRLVLRASDVACRVGGDEFAIVLPEAGASQAAQLYRRVQDAVSSSPIGGVERLTVSGGVAELIATDDATTFFERADEALYRAKSSGKSQLA